MKEINNSSDFILTLTITDADNVPIPYTEVDWEAQYYTTGGNVYKVGCTNGLLSSNCEIVGTSVNIYVNKFNWGRGGIVRRKIHVSFPDERFSDGRMDVFVKEQPTDFSIVL